MSRLSNASTAYSGVFGALVLFAFLSSSATAADADAPPPQSLSPGLRVRILAPDLFSNKVIGTVDQVSTDYLTVDVPGRAEPVSILREKITRLDVSEGPRSRGVDAAIGAVLGAGAGAAGGALAWRSGGDQIVGRGYVAGVCALLGAGVGALVGVAIPPGERWKEASTARFQVNFAPRLDHGLDLAVAWQF
jgi:hypothetical protein